MMKRKKDKAETKSDPPINPPDPDRAEQEAPGARRKEGETEESVVALATTLARFALDVARNTLRLNLPLEIPRLQEIRWVILSITELDPPAPFVNQPMTVSFSLWNFTNSSVSGQVTADFGGSFGGSFSIANLGPRQTAKGSFVYTPTAPGRGQIVTLTFTRDGAAARGRADILDDLIQDVAFFDVRTGYILEVSDTYQTPTPPTDSSGHVPFYWNKITCQGRTSFDDLLSDTPHEWTQVLGDDEMGGDVALSGFVCEDHFSGHDDDFNRDVAFLHPFHNDWEMFVAPDEPYQSLLAPTQAAGADPGYNRAIRYASNNNIGAPSGFMGVEISRAFVQLTAPDSLDLSGGSDPANAADDSDPNQRQVDGPYRARPGDRVAMLGRWIVDCGHDNFTTEIHEPLLLAIGRQEQSATSVQLIGRPYFVSQVFGGKGLSHAMVDGFAERLDEAHLDLFFPFLFATLKPIALRPTVVSPPFKGTRNFPFVVRPPVPRPTPTSHLRASYHFTVRSGVSVTVGSTGYDDELLVTVSMNSDEYKPADLPQRHNVHVSWDGPHGLLAGFPDEGKRTLIQGIMGAAGVLDPAVGIVWGNGFDTDRYDLPAPSSQYDNENVVRNAVVTNSGVNATNSGYSVDDGQPYPIYGWITLQWFDVTIRAVSYLNDVAAASATRLSVYKRKRPPTEDVIG
jgi:hypothetical protein